MRASLNSVPVTADHKQKTVTIKQEQEHKPQMGLNTKT